MWPIMDPSLAEGSKKRDTDEGLPSTDDQPDTPTPAVKRKVGSSASGSNKQQNNMLLLNAMRTTAIHSNTSFSAHALEINVEGSSTETPHDVRSSATPAPTATRAGTPKGAVGTSTSQEPPAKGLAGAGKKKRKSERKYLTYLFLRF